MAELIIGTIKNGTVVLPEGVDLPDGTKVEIHIPQKARLLKHAGLWKDWEGLDDLVKRIYEAREANVGREVEL